MLSSHSWLSFYILNLSNVQISNRSMQIFFFCYFLLIPIHKIDKLKFQSKSKFFFFIFVFVCVCQQMENISFVLCFDDHQLFGPLTSSTESNQCVQWQLLLFFLFSLHRLFNLFFLGQFFLRNAMAFSSSYSLKKMIILVHFTEFIFYFHFIFCFHFQF